jgi:cyclophilin family peptidyl-prolyl cis-trans isomerase
MPCTVVHTPAQSDQSWAAQFAGRAHTRGPADAPVSLVAFSDYQCTACAQMAATLKQLSLNHPDDLQLVYLEAPQTGQDKDALAVRAVEAADLQGMYWEMHDLLFEQQADWVDLAPSQFEDWAASQAGILGMDETRFRADFRSPAVADQLQQAILATVNVQGLALPLIYLNGDIPPLADLASLDTLVSMDVLIAHQFSDCPPWGIDPLKQYIVTLHTARGEATIELYPDKAPLAVNNFVFLARQGWYDGNTFQRVLPGVLAETGDPSGTGFGNPGYYFDTEAAPGLRFDQAGVVAMENTGINTNGSQFFITYGPVPRFDGQFTIIGRVLTGMDVLSTLAPRDPQPGSYLPPGDELIRVTVEER